MFSELKDDLNKQKSDLINKMFGELTAKLS